MKKYFLVICLSVVLMGCTTTQKAATIGGVGGATVGTIIGHQSGNDLTGAAIGTAAGALGGMMVGQHMDKKFCPVCGRNFTSDTKYCPVDGTELKTKE